MRSRHTSPIETIRLSQRDRRRFIDQINGNSKAVPSQMDRRSLRVDFNVGQLAVTITHPNRQVVTYNVLPRNLSRRGIGFIHGQFIYIDSPCEILMPSRDGGCWVPIVGKVVGCRHISGLLHEISVAFKQEIDVGQFIELTPEQEQRLKREVTNRTGTASGTETPAPPTDAVRNALVIIEDPAARHLVALWLQQLGFEAMEVDVADAERWVMERGIDLIVIDLAVEGGKGDRAIRKLKMTGFHGGLLAVSSDGKKATRELAFDAGVKAFLEMPFTHLNLQETIASLEKKKPHSKASEPAVDPLYPSIPVEPQMRPLLEEFVGMLDGYASNLDEALKINDHPKAMGICQRLKGSGASYGFESITETAKLAMTCLEAAEPDLKQIKTRVDELIKLLHRARVA